MRGKRLNILISPGFVAGLILLLLNDHVFKVLSPNWITGKLSDFSGLFIFPLFWTAFFHKSKTTVYSATAICFTLWKSLFSNPFIGIWNAFIPLTIGRTIDYTDLIALSVLPIS